MGDCRRRSSSSWSDLYPEIIQSISQHLKTRFDILSFRRVCKQWREHSVNLPLNFLSPLLPHRFLTPSNTLPRQLLFIGNDDVNFEINLFIESIYLLTLLVDNNIESEASQSSPSYWMVSASEPQPGKFRLSHPLTDLRIEHLPKAIDLTQFKVTELARGYILQDAYIRKVVLCSRSVSFSTSDCAVIDSHDYLCALRLSESGHPEWYKPRCRGDIHFDKLDDFVSFKGIHVAVDHHGRLFSVEYEAQDRRPLVVTGILVADHICNHERQLKRLVVDPLSDKLCLVEREHPTEVGFKVYEFNEECKKWDQVEALPHYRALFVGVSHCFFAPAPVGCLENCIIFESGSFNHFERDDNSHERLWGDRNIYECLGVYHLGKQEFSHMSDYPELLQMMQPPPACFSTSERESNEDEVMQSDSNSEDDSCQANEDGDAQSNSNNEDDSSKSNEDEEVRSDSNSEDDSYPSNEDKDVQSD